jgi:prefoldin alpha subunit
MNQELLIQAQLIKNQTDQLEEHLSLIDKQLIDLTALKEAITQLNKDKKEIISSLGNGVHLKSTISDKELFVEVGQGVIVKKKPEETIAIISEQLKLLAESKLNVQSQLDACQKALESLISKIER